MFPSSDDLVSLVATLSQAAASDGDYDSSGSRHGDEGAMALVAALLRAAGEAQVTAEEALAAAKPQTLRVDAPACVAPLVLCLQVRCMEQAHDRHCVVCRLILCPASACSQKLVHPGVDCVQRFFEEHCCPVCLIVG